MSRSWMNTVCWRDSTHYPRSLCKQMSFKLFSRLRIENRHLLRNCLLRLGALQTKTLQLRPKLCIPVPGLMLSRCQLYLCHCWQSLIPHRVWKLLFRLISLAAVRQGHHQASHIFHTQKFLKLQWLLISHGEILHQSTTHESSSIQNEISFIFKIWTRTKYSTDLGCDLTSRDTGLPIKD